MACLGSSAECGDAKPVEMTDTLGLGAQSTDRLCWMIEGAVTLVRADSMQATVRLSLILDGATLRPVLAFTEGRERWVLPQGPGAIPDPVGRAQRAGARLLGECAEHGTFDPARALEIAWDWFSIHPREAGQIVIRPRLATPVRPHPWSDGTLWPVSQRRCVWTVLARGSVFMDGRGVGGQPYKSGALILIDVSREEIFRGIYLP